MPSLTLLQQFRALLPSWKLFDDFGSTPRIYFQWKPDGGNYGEWQEAFRPGESRRLWEPAFNPRGNLRLAKLSIVDRLFSEDAHFTPATLAADVDYQLLARAIRQEIPAARGRYRFRVEYGEGRVVLNSLEHTL